MLLEYWITSANDSRSAHRTRGGNPVVELALGRLLDAGVEGELQAAAVVRSRLHPAGEHLPPARVAVELQVLRLAADDAVEALLEPLEALGVHAHEAEDMRREAPVRVEAPPFRHGVDARQPGPADGPGLARQRLALQPHERLAALELRAQRPHRHVQRGGEAGEPAVGR